MESACQFGLAVLQYWNGSPSGPFALLAFILPLFTELIVTGASEPGMKAMFIALLVKGPLMLVGMPGPLMNSPKASL